MKCYTTYRGREDPDQLTPMSSSPTDSSSVNFGMVTSTCMRHISLRALFRLEELRLLTIASKPCSPVMKGGRSISIETASPVYGNSRIWAPRASDLPAGQQGEKRFRNKRITNKCHKLDTHSPFVYKKEGPTNMKLSEIPVSEVILLLH